MMMLSTIIFISDQPVGYTVCIENQQCFFKPTEHTNANLEPPSFTASWNGETWAFNGVEDKKIIEQVQTALPVITKDIDFELSAAV